MGRVGDDRYKLTEAELLASTGHAPGQELTEIEPELEQHYEPPMRVTPMSPVTEIQALGQLTQARPERKKWARAAALVFLAPILLLVVMGVWSQFRVAHEPSLDERVQDLLDQQRAPAGGPGPAPVPVAQDCQGTPAASQPARLVLSCADAGVQVNATWSSWSSTGAKGSGEVLVNSCEPTCVSGTFAHYPAVLQLGRPERVGLRVYFTELMISFTGRSPGRDAYVVCELAGPSRAGSCGSAVVSQS
jgi:hypothetical protein